MEPALRLRWKQDEQISYEEFEADWQEHQEGGDGALQKLRDFAEKMSRVIVDDAALSDDESSASGWRDEEAERAPDSDGERDTDPPIGFAVQPTGHRVVEAGRPLELRVELVSAHAEAAAPQLQWERDGVVLEPDAVGGVRISSSASSSVLAVTSAQMAQSGCYRCRATPRDDCGYVEAQSDPCDVVVGRLPRAPAVSAVSAPQRKRGDGPRPQSALVEWKQTAWGDNPQLPVLYVPPALTCAAARGRPALSRRAPPRSVGIPR